MSADMTMPQLEEFLKSFKDKINIYHYYTVNIKLKYGLLAQEVQSLLKSFETAFSNAEILATDSESKSFHEGLETLQEKTLTEMEEIIKTLNRLIQKAENTYQLTRHERDPKSTIFDPSLEVLVKEPFIMLCEKIRKRFSEIESSYKDLLDFQQASLDLEERMMNLQKGVNEKIVALEKKQIDAYFQSVIKHAGQNSRVDSRMKSLIEHLKKTLDGQAAIKKDEKTTAINDVIEKALDLLKQLNKIIDQITIIKYKVNGQKNSVSKELTHIKKLKKESEAIMLKLITSEDDLNVKLTKLGIGTSINESDKKGSQDKTVESTQVPGNSKPDFIEFKLEYGVKIEGVKLQGLMLEKKPKIEDACEAHQRTFIPAAMAALSSLVKSIIPVIGSTDKTPPSSSKNT